MIVGLIGDIHLGSSYAIGKPHPNFYVNSRLIDYEETLIQTIDEIVAAGAKHIVMTGDIFEHRIPSLVQQKVFSRALSHAFEGGIENISIVVGNHDMTRKADVNSLAYLQALNLPNIRVYDELEAVVLEDDGEPACNLILMPFRDRKFYNTDSYDEAISHIKKEFEYQLAGISNQLPKLVVGHHCLEGTSFGEDEMAELYGENQLFLPVSMFDQIEMTTMGHVHTPSIISHKPYIAYVGSMEKRSGSETHDKVYALIDVAKLAQNPDSPAEAIEYRKEPCREIYDIKLDYSHLTLGDLLPGHIFSDIDEFGESHNLQQSIVRLGLKISGADDKYVQLKPIYKHLKEKWKIHHCTDIHPEIFSARQARNDKITEQVSDTNAFRMYLDSAIEDPELRGEILGAGIDIIKQVEVELATS